jgi:hypothetical protein
MDNDEIRMGADEIRKERRGRKARNMIWSSWLFVWGRVHIMSESLYIPA